MKHLWRFNNCSPVSVCTASNLTTLHLLVKCVSVMNSSASLIWLLTTTSHWRTIIQVLCWSAVHPSDILLDVSITVVVVVFTHKQLACRQSGPGIRPNCCSPAVCWKPWHTAVCVRVCVCMCLCARVFVCTCTHWCPSHWSSECGKFLRWRKPGWLTDCLTVTLK